MHSLTTAESWSSAALWARLLACREVGVAIAAVEDATAALVRLTADTDWQSQGVRALQDRLAQLEEGAEVVMGDLHVRAWEIERAAAA